MENPVYQPTNPIRFVTATSLYDGHDVSINIMRRIMQDSGAEVIHLGHNRSVHEVVDAAIQEDVQGIAVSSYQGGHLEYFKFMHDLLQEKGAGHVRIFAGGGGVILPDEIKELEAYGICKIFSPEDGRRMGLQGMINYKLEQCDFIPPRQLSSDLEILSKRDPQAVARFITAAEQLVREPDDELRTTQEEIRKLARQTPVLGITGTGGAGKAH
jgi:methylmalonyl-CoA mutase